MKRKIDKANPFYDVPRFAFAYDQLVDGMRVLDYGCFDASFGSKLIEHKKIDYYGVDKNVEAVQRADTRLNVMPLKGRLPFEDAFFDAVTILEVLEHIHDQGTVLRELRRVLKPGGLLIVSVPRKHLFSCLDAGNFKFVFPGIHRAYYSHKHSQTAYLQRYLNNPNGLVGDVEKAKSWHQHFRDGELTSLLDSNGFAVVELDTSGLMNGLFDFISIAKPFKPIFTQRLRNWDSYTFGQGCLYCVARRN